jgi:hypothetical protein
MAEVNNLNVDDINNTSNSISNNTNFNNNSNDNNNINLCNNEGNSTIDTKFNISNTDNNNGNADNIDNANDEFKYNTNNILNSFSLIQEFNNSKSEELEEISEEEIFKNFITIYTYNKVYYENMKILTEHFDYVIQNYYVESKKKCEELIEELQEYIYKNKLVLAQYYSEIIDNNIKIPKKYINIFSEYIKDCNN